MRLRTGLLIALTLAGFSLRLYYLTATHPFFDEYTTVLAARQVLRQGWPVLPSGLFYEHGLLSTYLIAPFAALFLATPVAEWQPAQWGLMLARWPSVLAGTLTIPLIYTIGRRCATLSFIPSSHSLLPSNPPAFQPSNLSPFPALFAAGLFAVSPEGMVWGGRARMYALATLLVLLTIYWAYRGAVYPAPARYRWLALLALLGTLLTQFGAMMLIPPLLMGMGAAGWLTWPARPGFSARLVVWRAALSRTGVSFPWFLRPTILGEGLALAAVIGLAVLVKRLGQPLGAAVLGSSESGSLPVELIETVSYQTTFYFSWAETIKFLARQFGPPHLFWLTVATLASLFIGLMTWLLRRRGPEAGDQGRGSGRRAAQLLFSPFNVFLWLVFGLILLEMVILLEPFRRNPRYLLMYLPLFYLIAGQAIYGLRFVTHDFSFHTLGSASRFTLHALLLPALLLLFTLPGLEDLRVALRTPEPAYEVAFARVRREWQPGDALLTMNTPAAGLYLGEVTGFSVQNEAGQFLLNHQAAPVDRWLGVPWVGTTAGFNEVLNTYPRVWFVIDTVRLPVYFRGDWQAVLNSQMEQVWAGDNALIYLSRPDRLPLSTRPSVLLNATLGNAIQFVGYSLQPSTFQSSDLPSSIAPSLHLTLFWQALAPLPADYTVFLHVRNATGATVAQYDGQPLHGTYPTSRWQPGETVMDPVVLALPPDLVAGTYTLVAGLYQLETLARLPVANDTSGENAIILGEVTLP